jgi:hypothetical protein
MTKLSPDAQVVLEAANGAQSYGPDDCLNESRWIAAAALRAVADQVVPWRPEPTEESVSPTVDFGYAWALFSQANDVRQEILAIADELEGTK